MKEYVIGAVIGAGVALTILAPAKCEAQTTYFYGPQGQPAGNAIQYGNTTYVYGPQGQPVGNAMQYGNTTYVYGPQGQPIGSAMAPAPLLVVPSTPLNLQPSLTPMYDSIFGR